MPRGSRNKHPKSNKPSAKRDADKDIIEIAINDEDKTQIYERVKNSLSEKYLLITNPNLKYLAPKITPIKDDSLVSSSDEEYQSLFAHIIAQNLDKEFIELISSGAIDFIYNEEIHDKPIFVHFSPCNNSSKLARSSIDIDYVYIVKKFNMLMDLREYFLRKYFFEILSMRIYKDTNKAEIHKTTLENHLRIFLKAQKEFENSVQLFTENLVNTIQLGIFDAFKSDPEKNTMSFIEFRENHPELLLNQESIIFLNSLQSYLKDEFNAKTNSLPDYLKHFPSNITEDGLQKIFYNIENVFASIEPNTISMFENSFLKDFDIKLIDDFISKETKTTYEEIKSNKSFSIKVKNLVKIVVFGFYDHFKLFQELKHKDFANALLSDSEDIFNHQLSSFYSQNTNMGDSLSFDRWVMLNEFRLNKNSLIFGCSKQYEDKIFPENFKKNLWNLLLFTRDVRNINNLSLDFLIYQQNQENALEIFLQGKSNNSRKDKDHIDCIQNLVTNGFALFSHLKNLNKDRLIELIKTNFDEENSKELVKKLNILEDFEKKLIDKTIDKTIKNQELSNILDAFETHLKKDPKNISKPVPISKNNKIEKTENILNLTGFLIYLDRTGFISHLNSEKDDSSKKLLEKIDKFIHCLDEESTLFKDKLARELVAEEEKEKKKNDKQKSGQKPIKTKSSPVQEDVTNEALSEPSDEDSAPVQQDVINEALVKNTIATIQENVEKSLTKFNDFFKYLYGVDWLKATKIGLYGSRVYSQLLKQTKPELEIQYDQNSDFDFFCISESIFPCCTDKEIAKQNFKEILDGFNKSNPNFQIRLKSDETDSVNLNWVKKSLSFKLIAEFHHGAITYETEFDLNFYTPESMKHHLQWQYNFERVMMIKYQDGQFELKTNNHNSEESEIHQFIESACDSKKDDFLYSTNREANGYLSRIYHKKGIFKCLDETEIDKIKLKLLEDEVIREKIIKEYKFYLEHKSLESTKPNNATGIVNMVEKDLLLSEILKKETPLTSINQASAETSQKSKLSL